MVNVIYFAYTFLVVFLIGCSYKYKTSKNLIVVIMMLLSMKCNYRIFDFEKTKDVMGEKKW